MSANLTDMVDEVRALSNRLYDSRDASDRSIADQLAEMAERFAPTLVPLDANMGAARHHVGHATEAVAADLALPKAGTLREMILVSISRSTRPGFVIPGVLNIGTRDGLTQEEAALYMNKRHYSVAPRFAELARMGWIKDSGRTRPTSSGTQAIVWVFTDEGYRAWETQ